MGRKYAKNLKRPFNLSVSDTDMEIIEWLADFLSTTKSDAVRTALRSFAGQMKALDSDLRGRKFDK